MKCDCVQVVNKFVANANAQKDVIQSERLPPKTSLCITCCAVYVVKTPVTAKTL